MPSTVPRRFAGFDCRALDLLIELEANNSVAWFDAHRAQFRDLLIEPATDLVFEMGPLLRATLSPGLRAEPRIGGSILSMRRNVRLSREDPFRTDLELRFWEGRGTSDQHSGFYARIGPHHLTIGAGIALFPPDVLLRYRDHVDRPDTGRELARCLAQLRAAGAELGGRRLRRTPRPFPADHERRALLTHLGLVMERVEPLPCAMPEAVVGPVLPELLLTGFKRLAPLWRWLRELE